MSKIKAQSNISNVGSNLNWPVNYASLNPTIYNVYSVYESEKHYPWCTGQSESILEKVLVAFAFGAAVLFLCFSVLVIL